MPCKKQMASTPALIISILRTKFLSPAATRQFLLTYLRSSVGNSATQLFSWRILLLLLETAPHSILNRIRPHASSKGVQSSELQESGLTNQNDCRTTLNLHEPQKFRNKSPTLDSTSIFLLPKSWAYSSRSQLYLLPFTW